jgi:hypothetical protein
MGGKNAIIVLDDANLELVTDATLWAAFGTTGQRCTAASRLIVQKGIAPKLKEALLARTRKLTLGDGLDPKVDVGPVINKTALDRIHNYVQIGKKEGARALVGAEIADVNGKGFFYAPTLLEVVQPGSTLEQEEVFGPVLSIVEVNSFEEAIEVNNRSQYGLSTSIFTQDVNRAFTAMRDIFTGLVYINHGTTGAEIQFPFGGVRGTGNGHRDLCGLLRQAAARPDRQSRGMMKNFYIFLTALGLSFPYYFIYRFFAANKGAPIPAILQLFETNMSAAFIADLLVSVLVFWAFVYFESKRIKMKNWWVFFPATLIGLSFAFPLYLYFREDHLEKSK